MALMVKGEVPSEPLDQQHALILLMWVSRWQEWISASNHP